MGVARPLDKEKNHYLEYLNTDQKKAVLGVVKSFAKEEYAWWEDKDFVKELDRRSEELESGKVKGLTFDEMAEGVRQGNVSDYQVSSKLLVNNLNLPTHLKQLSRRAITYTTPHFCQLSPKYLS